ncbi:MFS transporter [Sphingomonas sp. 7/4-4]|jgi:inositol transporter-like SP family MFS transporter|uniref:MFS transporter n=1 Tax=Sphingomonas sp. 7/4-4 TaxID=3018446 RepID=UPI0022F39B8A|nr:MFS transporter [Sphingomonas sp. 7/4-4]WBY09766.1 MFS transporter [Sphingomonas sp. 7/4-4]
MSETRDHKWRDTILAGLANYIDAGSIVAGSVALGLWKQIYGLSDGFIGLIGAFSANAISAGIGALIGGILCDKFGRKKIYQYDMLFYAFGMLFLVFASAPWMIVLGFVLVGLAVGADIPASWSLIAEQAPDDKRGAHSGVAQLLWYLGPVAVLVAAFFLQPWGITGVRWIFAHLAVLAIALTFLRSRMRESERWEEAQAASAGRALSQNWRELFSPRYLGAVLFLASMYGFWNLWAGFNGFFTPFLVKEHNLPGWVETIVPASYFLIGMISIFAIFMTLSDKVNQRLLFGISAALHVIGMAILAIFGFTLEVYIAHVVIMGVAGGFGAQSFFQLWSAELFPTAIRSTAQGLTFAIVRVGLGIWSFFVPWLASTNYTTLAWILTGFLVASGVIGLIWAPRNEGKSLEQIAAARA